MDRITFYSDPAHGWYAVPVVELVRLGIAGKITTYSFLSSDGLMAYLEEDCDATTFADALTAAGERFPECAEVFSNGDSAVRRLKPYPNPNYNPRTGWKVQS